MVNEFQTKKPEKKKKTKKQNQKPLTGMGFKFQMQVYCGRLKLTQLTKTDLLIPSL